MTDINAKRTWNVAVRGKVVASDLASFREAAEVAAGKCHCSLWECECDEISVVRAVGPGRLETVIVCVPNVGYGRLTRPVDPVERSHTTTRIEMNGYTIVGWPPGAFVVAGAQIGTHSDVIDAILKGDNK